MTMYYQTDRFRECACGCRSVVEGLVRGRPRLFVSGHNLRKVEKTNDHRRKIGLGQRRAWDDGRRQRVSIGEVRVKNGVRQVRVRSENGWAYWKSEASPLDKYREMSTEQLL